MKRAHGAVVTALILVLALAGCAPAAAPVTDGGVSWENYPAHAGQDGDVLVDYPDQAEIAPSATATMTLIAGAIEAQTGVPLVAIDSESSWFSEDNWHPQLGNGYGGKSMLTTVNCCELASETAPSQSEWAGIITAASAAAVEAGLGSFVIDDNGELCTLGEECWIMSAFATDGVQWVGLTIWNRAMDLTGEAEKEAEKFGWPIELVSIRYGATVVQAGQKAVFADAMQDFIGLDRPDATTSD